MHFICMSQKEQMVEKTIISHTVYERRNRLLQLGLDNINRLLHSKYPDRKKHRGMYQDGKLLLLSLI